jgi:transcriptional regulator with GAF, ATPase, and Fis domain
MPDQVRHDGFGTFYEAIKVRGSMLDKLEFYREATFHIASYMDNEKAMEDLLVYLRKTMAIQALAWYTYDQSQGAIHIQAALTMKGIVNLEDQIIPLAGEIRRQAENLSRLRFRLIENTSNDLLASTLLESLSGFVGIENRSLLLMSLDWQGTMLGNLCIFSEQPVFRDSEYLELFLMLQAPFSFATYHMRRFMELIQLKNRVTEEKEFLEQELQRITEQKLIGADSGLREITASVDQLAHVDTPVLIMGETGVGKELVANAIQKASSRRDGPYVKVNCGAIPDTLMDSELFGHEKGAFTGAVSLRRGKFELANSGTIFLDEIGELRHQAQVRLLHVLQNQEVERVGGSKRIKVDVRFIAATHRNLVEMVKEGKFREDLFFRIHVFPIVVPPLRHRKQDIRVLAEHFVTKKAQDMKLGKTPKIDPGSIKSLLNHDWPGNVRELENLVERALILNPRGLVNFDPLLQSAPSISKKYLDDEEILLPLDEINRRHIQRAMAMSYGKINGPGGAAELLKIHPNTLRRRLEKLGIDYGRKHKESYSVINSQMKD